MLSLSLWAHFTYPHVYTYSCLYLNIYIYVCRGREGEASFTLRVFSIGELYTERHGCRHVQLYLQMKKEDLHRSTKYLDSFASASLSWDEANWPVCELLFNRIDGEASLSSCEITTTSSFETSKNFLLDLTIRLSEGVYLTLIYLAIFSLSVSLPLICLPIYEPSTEYVQTYDCCVYICVIGMRGRAARRIAAREEEEEENSPSSAFALLPFYLSLFLILSYSLKSTAKCWLESMKGEAISWSFSSIATLVQGFPWRTSETGGVEGSISVAVGGGGFSVTRVTGTFSFSFFASFSFFSPFGESSEGTGFSVDAWCLTGCLDWSISILSLSAEASLGELEESEEGAEREMSALRIKPSPAAAAAALVELEASVSLSSWSVQDAEHTERESERRKIHTERDHW